MRLQTAREAYERRPFLKVAVTGHSGAGKTDWAARSPRPLVLLTESQAMPSILVANPDAMVVPIESWADFREAFTAVKLGRPVQLQVGDELQPALEVTLAGTTVVVQTLVVDSFTDLQRFAYAHKLGVDAGRMDRLDLDTASNALRIDEHGLLVSAAEEVWRQQRSLQCNTVFLFLARDVQDDTGVKQTLPMLTGKSLPYSMGQFFNASGLAQVRRSDNGTMQHVIRWSSSTAAALTKPGPGWPAVTQNTRTAGHTTLGSLLRFTFPDMVVASELHDAADYVQASAASAASTPAPATTTPAPAAPAASTTSTTTNPPAVQAPTSARRRRA
jgi:hypothetical protein